jgi:type I restriction enzyme, S subunit
MTTESKTPQIRFKGFSGEWEKKEFNKSFTNISNNTLSRAELNYNFGLAKNIHYGDVLIKFGELLDTEKDEIPFISNNDFVNKLKSAKLQNGDVIIADAAEDEIVGKCTEIFNIGGEIVFSGLHTIAIRPILPFASKYLGYYMNSPSYHNQLLPLLQGTKVLSISKSAIKNTEIHSPNDSSEQSKIGDYFQNLDKLIEQKEKKYQKLRQFKKAMLDKMFPKNGANTPEIRFKGFSGEWEEKKLGELANFLKGQGYSKNDLIEVGAPIILYGRLYTKYQTTISSVDTFVIEKHSSIYSKGNEVIVPSSGETAEDIARASAVTVAGIILGGDLNIIYPNDKIDNVFLALNISNGKTQKDLSKKAQGKSVVHLRNTDLKEVDLYYPDRTEQTKIGDYFQNLDKLIDLNNVELQKLKNIKKASLEKMFV